MSGEFVNVVRRGFEAYNRHDVDALCEVATEDCEFSTFVEGRIEGFLRGHDGIRAWQASEAEAWEYLVVEDPSFRQVTADRVLVAGRVKGKGRTSGIDMDAPAAWVLDRQGGKIARFTSYGDVNEALVAVGLAETER